MTSARGEATEIAREVSGRVDALYVFGGDGTYNEVLNGIDAETPVGFVPGGGASVLPRALGLPREPFAAAQRLAEPRATRRIAVGRANGHRFGFACGIGLDAEVVRAVDELGRRPDGRRPGNLAFAWTGMRTLTKRRFRLEPALEVEGAGRAAFVMVSNGPAFTYAGPVAVRPAPAASFEGGLDLVGPVRMRPRDLPRIAWYAAGRGDRDEAEDLVYVHDADRIVITCDRPLPLEADGEDLGDVERVVLEAERDAVTVLV
jgi:diacylglycerol kinase family enzyme